MATPITIIIASNQTTERERLRTPLVRQPDFQVVGEAQNDQECLDLVLRFRPRVVLLQEDIPTQGGLALAQQITTRAGFSSIIMMLKHADPPSEELWHKMLHAGVLDFITHNTHTEVVITEIRHAAFAQKGSIGPGPAGEATPKHWVITVVAPRGGTGKTVIATNLAVALARKKNKVTLLDLNLGCGDVAMLLDLVPQRTVADLLTSYAGIDEDVMENLMLEHSSGLYVLPSPTDGNFDSSGMPRSVVQNVLQFIQNRCRFTIADCGPAGLEGTLAAMDASDIILVVVGHDLPRLQDAKQYLRGLVAANYSKDRIRVVVNRSGIGKSINKKEIESILEFPVTAYLSNDAELVADSVNLGRPLVLAWSQKPFARELLKLADELAPHGAADPEEGRSLFGLSFGFAQETNHECQT